MRKTEVYQIRLESQEKQQAFEVFQQLGISPAQAIRLFFRQVVRTQSIPFSIENNLHQDPKMLHLNQSTTTDTPETISPSSPATQYPPHQALESTDLDIFTQLNAILGENKGL